MNPLTCAEVQTQLDLYAAGACDPPTAAALARHLATCRECGRAHREAQHLQALLDIRFRESEGIERIRSRVQTAPRRTLRGVRTLPFLRRALAVAAMLLIAISLPALLGPLDQTNGRPVATVLWASPESQYASRSPGTFELAQGELWVRVHPGAKQSSRPGNVTVQTPGGVATVQGTEFFIAADKNRVLVTVRDGRVKLTNPRGDAEARPGEVLQGGPAEAPRREVEALSLRFGRQYRPEPVKASPRLLAQKPPFNLSKAVDYKRVAAAFPLEKVMAALERDGFVVLPGSGQDTLGAAYQALRAHDVPVVVTADAVLHLCRAQFAETLRDLEERIFVPELTGLLRALVDALDRLPPGGSEEARTLAMGYLAVALRVLEPDAPLPQAVDAAAVGEVVAAIRRHERGPVRVRLLGRNEDFGAYRPEGHYRQSERLQRYHAAMTWLGRMGLVVRAGLVTPEEARRQTLAATLITQALAQTRLPDGRLARTAWERIDAVMSFYVGLTEGIGPQQYGEALARVGGKLDQADFGSFKVELGKQVPIADDGGKATVTTPAALLDRLAPDEGFRLFGRRFTPDAYMLGRLVAPRVGPPTREGQFTLTRTLDGRAIRGLPRGLDVMAVLGSSRARELLRDLGDDAYRGYDDGVADLRRRFASFDAVDWNRNLHWSWLYALQPLLAEGDAASPAFRTSMAYRTKALNTALAFWAHRRQDVALYARESKTAEAKAQEAKALKAPRSAPDIVRGATDVPYVEPLPDLYARLLALARMTRDGLTTMGVLDAPGKARLEHLEKLLRGLKGIAEKELAGQALTADDQAFLRRFVEDPEGVQLQKALTTVAVATIHTDANSNQVLQEATGSLDVGLFLYQRPDGRQALAAGPVLSYYEFKRPSADPLTEAGWRRLLTGATPARPSWFIVHPGGTR